MSDDQRPARPAQHEEAGDEVEAHSAKPAANDESGDETESSDEVEAHGHFRKARPA